MMQQRRFTKEFEEEAVRLVQTSGQTQRENADDLGIGLSTLVESASDVPDRAPFNASHSWGACRRRRK